MPSAISGAVVLVTGANGGLGREFVASELFLPVEDSTDADLSQWRMLRARNKWQAAEDVPHHPFPGTYPVVVTDTQDWGGWRVPGAEYDRDPQRIEYQARLIAAAPRLMAVAQALVDAVAESPEDAPPESLSLARQARDVLRTITEILTGPPEALLAPPSAPSADKTAAASQTRRATVRAA